MLKKGFKKKTLFEQFFKNAVLFKNYLFILGMLDLCYCLRAFPSCSGQASHFGAISCALYALGLQ